MPVIVPGVPTSDQRCSQGSDIFMMNDLDPVLKVSKSLGFYSFTQDCQFTPQNVFHGGLK